MPVKAEHVGRTWPRTRAYAVGREKVREFATAIGERNPLSHDVEAARAAGYADVVAPPTFAVVVTQAAMDAVLFDPELGVDYSMVVHGEQRFSYSRPVVAGDELTSLPRLANLRAMGGNEILTVEAEVRDAADAHVLTATAVIVVRGTAQEG